MVRVKTPVFATALLLSWALSGCGADRSPSLAALPLAPRTHVTMRLRTCDRGANAFCALQLVVQGSGYASSQSLLRAENRVLRARGWTHADAPVGQERGADSPGDKLRVTYATASGELEAVDLGWIKRPRPLTVALSRAIFGHEATLAVVLEIGSSV
jgi:hypothetical protein